ncbi:HAD family hydrolase [Ferdinandcohnia sp. Marseille-Q9671]
MFKAILFDFDGVICESVNIKSQAFREMFMKYGNDIANKVVTYHESNGGISRFEKFKHYYNNFLNQEINQQELQILGEEFSNLVFQKVIDSDFVKGAFEFISNHYMDYKFFIVTGTPQEEIIKICDERELSKYFIEILGSPLNKSTIINNILKEYNYNKNEVVMVGDAMTDFTAASETDVPFIGRVAHDNPFPLGTTLIDDLINLNQVLSEKSKSTDLIVVS